MAGFEGLIHREVPTSDGVESVDDAVEAIRLLVHLSEPAAAEDTSELAVLLREDVRPRPTVGAVGTERAPALAIAQIRGRFCGAATLRLHAAAGHQLAQHLTQHRAPFMHRWGSAFRVHSPIGSITANSLGKLLWAFGKQITEPALAPRGHV